MEDSGHISIESNLLFGILYQIIFESQYKESPSSALFNFLDFVHWLSLLRILKTSRAHCTFSLNQYPWTFFSLWCWEPNIQVSVVWTVYSWANPCCWRFTLSSDNFSRAWVSEVIWVSSLLILLSGTESSKKSWRLSSRSSHCLSGSDRCQKSHDLSLEPEMRLQGFVPNFFKCKE
jgi:hypothetical protein